MLLSTVYGLIYYALGAVVLYFVIRFAVKHGILDAEKMKNK